jgi:ComEC/Rec2-related protein
MSAPFVSVILAFCSFVVLYIFLVFVAKKIPYLQYMSQVLSSGFALVVFIAGAVYGFGSGIHEIIVAPAVGKPVQACGTVLSVPANPKYPIANIILTSVDSGEGKRYSRIAVSYHSGTRSQHDLQSGTQIVLTGVLTLQNHASNQSWLLHFLQPTYQFLGKVTVKKEASKYGPMLSIRSRIHQNILNTYSRDQSMKTQEGLLESIVFGGNIVSDQIHQVFLRAGVLHILAASGANLLFMERIVSPVLFYTFHKLPFGRWFVFGGSIGFIWLYTALCNSQISILRAAWMSSYRTTGRFVGRTASPWSSLLFAALCMSLYNPGQLWSVSALLSFVATFAVDSAIHGKHRIYAKGKKKQNDTLRPVYTRLSFVWVHTRNILWMSVLVDLYTAPLVEVLFGQWTPYAIVSNLLIEPVLVLLLPSAAIWFVLVLVSSVVPIFHSICAVSTVCVFFLAQTLEIVLTWISSLPGALVTLPVFPPVWFMAYYTCLVLFSSIIPSVRAYLQRPRSKLGLSGERL